MKIRRMAQFSMTVGLLALASALFAQGVLPTAMDSPQGVVTARKLMMKAVSDNMKDIGDKLQNGRLPAAAVNAGSIGAMAVVLPPLYREKHDAVYPVAGSGSFFKGGAAADFESAAAQLKAGADALQAAAGKNDPAGAQTGLDSLKSACGACHGAFRGKY